MTDAAWNKDLKRAGLAWTFSGPSITSISQESLIQDFVGSPLVAEALAVRSALSHALTLDLPSLKVMSDNQTLIRAINSQIQYK